MTKAARYWVVVPAAGIGARFASETPKQYASLAGASVLEHALKPLFIHPKLHAVVIALAPNDEHFAKLEFTQHGTQLEQVEGGGSRAQSVLNGLQFLQGKAKQNDFVLVHDAARPCLQAAEIDDLLAASEDEAVGAILALPMNDTVKRVVGQQIVETVDRTALWRAVTPQMFRFGVLFDALTSALAANFETTDEASAVERLGLTVNIVEAKASNIKITRQEDVSIAESLLSLERG